MIMWRREGGYQHECGPRLMLTIVGHDTYIQSDSLNIVNCYWISLAREIAAMD